ncbi:hypothetical protein H4R18_002513 [Coemansia javaensis]|uniref:Peptidase A22B, signal peptide peptidase n=1 Tax=Coemansia javaensis TaxID=2761396 RepID=A0A9W8LJ19_9FUNG|nr:hypothetical protein H4R18_002513 [Coemansia javaensis]
MADAGVLFAYAAIGAMALGPIYFGSYGSVGRVPGAAAGRKHKRERGQFAEYSDSEDEDEESESLSSADAYMLPVYGSCALVTMFLVLKYLKSEWVAALVSAYVAVVGVAAVAQVTVRAAKRATGVKLPLVHVHVAHRARTVAHVQFTALHVAAVAWGAAVTGAYLWTKHWTASNALGLAASFSAIMLLRLDSFKTGMIMLAGLFVYDVFWVFGTPVMVTVAKGFDAPIKVVFPKALFPPGGGGAGLQFTMLGLGDIVVPGIFLALALRFDRHRYLESLGFRKGGALPAALGGRRRGFAFPTPYFSACLAAYVAGLATTIAVMHSFKAAQPALLYLSPACILAVLGTAAARGEISEVFAYTEEEEEDEEGKGAKAKAKAKAKDGVTTRSMAAASKDDDDDDDDDDDNNDNNEGGVAEPPEPRYNLRSHVTSASELADDEHERSGSVAAGSDAEPATPTKAGRARRGGKAKGNKGRR